MQLIDIGLNLTHDSFDHDRCALLERARAAGVAGFIITGTDVAGSRAALAMARSNGNGFFCTAGVHPHHAGELDDAGVAALRELLDDDRVVAVGECGLDFFRNFSPREDQFRAFDRQLDLAAASGKPLFLHQRDAHAELMQRLAARRGEFSGGVVHCFTDGPAELQDILDAGFHVGITGWLCDERRGQALREAVRGLPMDRFMVETDAPYLLPRDLPEPERSAAGRRNEPRFLPHIVEKLAGLMDREPADIARASTENATRLFRLPG